MGTKELLINQYHGDPQMERQDMEKWISLFDKIDALLKSKGYINVAIDGNSGAGKSTLASFIGNVYDCNIFHMDDFFLPPELKTKARLDEVGGNVDYIRFKQEVIKGLISRSPFQYQVYNCKQQAMSKTIEVLPKKLNIIEGSYSMHPTLIDHYDLKVFLHLDEKEQSSRILERNGESMLKRFLEEWIPLENRYFKELKIREQCDVVF